MASLWRRLPIQAGDAQLPPLLVSTVFKSDNYTLYLTDLTHIWSESLNRRALFARSHEVNTSIDPTESDQLQIFLDKLKEGVNGGRNTTSAISVSPDSGRPTLTLNITVNLPGGLAPLEWPFRLAPAPQSLLMAQLTIPLLQAQHYRMQEVSGLTDLLKEKDHVIQKMLDKYEGQGLELGQVFPQAIAKGGRSLSRIKAEEKIKGLQAFDLESFRENLEDEETIDTTELLQSIFSSENQKSLRFNISPTISEEKSNWWEGTKGQTINIFDEGKSTSSINADKIRLNAEPIPTAPESTTDDDDFQVQATPPASHKFKRKVPKLADDSTDEEDDLDVAPSQRSKISDSQLSIHAGIASSQRQTKIGIVGGKKSRQKSALQQTSPCDDEPIPRSHSQAKNSSVVRGKKACEAPRADVSSTDDEQFSPSSKGNKLESANLKKIQSHSVEHADTTDEDEPSLRKSKSPSKSSGMRAHETPSEDKDTNQDRPHTISKRLGIIGGKKTAPTVDDDTTDGGESHLEPPKKKGRLGTLGGKKSEPTPSSSDEDQSPKPSKAKTKLGMLGGKKKQVTPSPSTAKDSPDPEDESSKTPPHAKRELGAVGGRGALTSAELPKDVGLLTGQSVKKEETPSLEETAEERADKKRLQLKRALEEKSKAPAKKKKKF